MTNYTIITDKEKLLDFIYNFLPNTDKHEAFYCCLLARSKYCKNNEHITHIRSDKQQLKRFTSTKEFLYEKIKQLECSLGSYYQNHVEIPQEALALYITPNPRNYITATKNGLVRFAELLTQETSYTGYNPHQVIMSEIQKAISRKIYFDVDIDDASITINELKNSVSSLLNDNCISFLQTRGGFHVLIELEKIQEQYKKTWYKSIMQLKGVDVNNVGKDTMIPIVGCYQGGFTPSFV